MTDLLARLYNEAGMFYNSCHAFLTKGLKVRYDTYLSQVLLSTTVGSETERIQDVCIFKLF
jgi:hypothetical protein